MSATPEHLATLEHRLLLAQAEVVRLQQAIAQHPDTKSPSPDYPPLPSPSSASIALPLSSLPPALLNEPWAQPPSPDTCKMVSWLQNWQQPYPRPALPKDDTIRAKAAQVFTVSASGGDGEVLSRLCQMARHIFHVQFAAVNIVAQDRVHFRGSDIVHPPLMGMTGAPREVSICNWTIAKGKSLVIPDMAMEAATRDNPICSDYGCRFYAGSPLTTAAGQHIGTFCLLDTQPNHHFSDGAQALLELLATTAVTSLELTELKKSRERFHRHVLANISHELRTPVHGILGLCDLIGDSGELSSTQFTNLTDAKNQAREALSLINDMLDFVKLDAAQLFLTQDAFHPHDLLTKTTSLLNTAAAARLVKVRLFQPYTHKMTCRGDERRFGQVLTILVSNAIKFSKPNHYVELHVSHHSTRPTLRPANPTYHSYSPTTGDATSGADEGAFFLYIRVADAGSGIAPTRLPHVFNKFYEEELKSFAPRTDGLGLGLAVCRLLVKLMGGQLLVESEVGRGSFFHVALPFHYDSTNTSEVGITEKERQTLSQFTSAVTSSLQLTPLHSPNHELSRRLTNFNNYADPVAMAAAALQRQSPVQLHRHTMSLRDISEDKVDEKSQRSNAHLQPRHAASATTSPSSPLPRSIDRLTVLIVDDNLVNLKVAARFLDSSGHVCICVQSGKEALEVAQSRAVDVVLMDLQMPEMDGLECTRRLRQMEVEGQLHRADPSRSSGARLPIIAVTASEGSGVKDRCLADGMDACVFKPFNRAQLLSTMMAFVVANHR